MSLNFDKTYRCVTENDFPYFSAKTYVVGTQKNRLDERVILSIQNTCLNSWIKNNRNLTLKCFLITVTYSKYELYC